MVFGILLFVGMIAFGRDFIILWMGPHFEISYPILAIYASSSLVAVAFSLVDPIYSGLNRVRLSASLLLLQGVTNLCLTLILVLTFNMGILGVAWGTFFPRIAYSIIVGLIAMGWIGIRPAHFVRTVAIRWLLLSGVFYSICLAINVIPATGNWATFFVKVAAASVIYFPLGWLILLDSQMKLRIRNAAANRLPAVFGWVGTQ